MPMPKVKFNINFDFFGVASRPLIGVDIGTSSVKMVELSKNTKEGVTRYQIESYAIEPLPSGAVRDGDIVDLDTVSDCMLRCWKRLGTRLKNISLAMPASAVITKKITVPANQHEDDLAFQVETEASQYIPFALDEVELDFQETGISLDNPDEIEILIVASRKDKVDDRVATALSAGLKTVIMDVEPYAAQAAFGLIEGKLPESDKDKVIALVDIGSMTTRINMLHSGQSIYMRDQPVGGNQLSQEMQSQLNLSPEEVEAAKRSGNLPDNYKSDVLQPFCKTLSIEIMRAIQFFFTSTQHTKVDYIFIAGGCAVIPGLHEIIATHTQIMTLIANPFSSIGLSSRVIAKQLNMDAPSLLLACGLAMRSLDPS